MQHKLFHFNVHSMHWVYAWAEVLVIILALFMFVTPAAADKRMQDRSLYMNSARAGETTAYTVSFRYMSPETVGSVDLRFCIDPIPYHPCVTPPGLDVSSAELSEQLGEMGYSILSQTTNRIILTRTPTLVAPDTTISSYKFENIVNPNNMTQSFSIRLKTHTSTNATGQQIDFGSIKGQITNEIELVTQVPPILVFCMAEQIGLNCVNSNKKYFTDMGTLSTTGTLTAQSQMAVGTNASGGFAITANGPTMSSGTNIIRNPTTPTESRPGTNQFGINLVANTSPEVGEDMQGEWSNAVVSPDYAIPNHYKYVPGDTVAYSPNVSLMRKYTVSYILNAAPQLRAGVYNTSVTFIASGRF